MIAVVGPLPLTEHMFWFVLMSLLAFLTYAGLREEHIPSAVRAGLLGWVRFLFGSALLLGVFSALSHWL